MAKSIMVVDDSATMRKIVTRAVQMSGLDISRTVQASNGAEALKKLGSSPVDILLLDINMPEMSGKEMVKKIRDELPQCAETIIIMVSADSSPEVADKAIADGANGFITKPFPPEIFREKLSPFMDLKEAS